MPLIKEISLSLFLSIPLVIYTQQSNDKKCQVLNRCLNFDKLQERFFICSDKWEVIKIIDATNYFNHCKLDILCGHKTFWDTSAPDSITANTIEIYKVQKRGKKTTVFFRRPLTGAAVILTCSRNKILSYSVGAF